ncbi:MAG TPA: aminotransferase class V-fold PLP-dependent enzyme [Coriobacteriia bacterium]
MATTDKAPRGSADAPCAVYLDNGATSWPKPASVVEAMVDAMERAGGNPGRGAHPLALAASRVIFEARRDAAALLGVPDPRDLLLLAGATEGCNLMLKGLLTAGDRVVVSSMEHNAVARPLHLLAQRGITVDVVSADASGFVEPDAVERAVALAPTRAVVCQHASNVTGTVQPIGDIADIAHEAGALLLVDGAQGAGHLAVDLAALDVDAYAVSGHKGLLGPQGVGLLYLRPGLNAEQLLEGGTGGASSHDPAQPLERPDRYEAGTPNTPGIAGLGAAVRLHLEQGAAIRDAEQRVARRFREGLSRMPHVTPLGPAPAEESVPIVSFISDAADPDRIAFELDKRYGVAVRAGLHCAPAAHRTLGTLETGAVRLGVGWRTTEDDADFVLDAIARILA